MSVALPNSEPYFALVAMTAVVTGLLLTAIGLFRLGWLADFLSVPIVTGFMCGIGVIIAVHQLPHALGVTSEGDSVVQRLVQISHHLGHVSAWSMAVALATLVIMVVGEAINPRLPWALVAVVLGAVLATSLSLHRFGVQLLGPVSVSLPHWRLATSSLHDWRVVVTTSFTLVIVIMSQSAATARSSADEMGVADDLSRDFVGVGAANIVTGLLGAFPVNASPARTTVAQLAGGRTKLVGIVAGLGALLLSPLAGNARYVPLASLAGVLIFIAGRLINISRLRKVWHVSRIEFIFAMVAWAGVIFLGVEIGLAVAVGLAILAQMWHAARPRMVEMGRRSGTTSWETLDVEGVAVVPQILVVLFDEDLFFANAGVFRRELHEKMSQRPQTRHVVLDAVAISEIDFTALAILSDVVQDLRREGISLSFARSAAKIREVLSRAGDAALRDISFFESVDAAVTHALN